MVQTPGRLEVEHDCAKMLENVVSYLRDPSQRGVRTVYSTSGLSGDDWFAAKIHSHLPVMALREVYPVGAVRQVYSSYGRDYSVQVDLDSIRTPRPDGVLQ